MLRFWETEFPQLRPNKGGTGQRLYRRRDVEMALRIKTLLYDQGYTIPGARQVFKSEQKQKAPLLALGIEAAPAKVEKVEKAEAPNSVDPTRLRRLRHEMQELLTLLSKPVTVLRPRGTRPVRSIRTARRWRPTPPTQPSSVCSTSRSCFPTDRQIAAGTGAQADRMRWLLLPERMPFGGCE